MKNQLKEQKNVENMGQNERMISIIGGAMLLGAGLKRISWSKLPLAVGGAYMLYRGATGKDPVYDAIGIERTHRYGKSGIEANTSITINRPRHEVYNFFKNFERLPSFMQHLESVEVISGQGVGSRSHWKAKAPLGMTVEWDAIVTEDRQNERLGWRTLPDSDVEHEGRVIFRDAPGGRGTVVEAWLVYQVPGGSAGAAVAKLFGEEPEMQIRDDFKRMKQLMETGSVRS